MTRVGLWERRWDIAPSLFPFPFPLPSPSRACSLRPVRRDDLGPLSGHRCAAGGGGRREGAAAGAADADLLRRRRRRWCGVGGGWGTWTGSSGGRRRSRRSKTRGGSGRSYCCRCCRCCSCCCCVTRASSSPDWPGPLVVCVRGNDGCCCCGCRPLGPSRIGWQWDECSGGGGRSRRGETAAVTLGLMCFHGEGVKGKGESRRTRLPPFSHHSTRIHTNNALSSSADILLDPSLICTCARERFAPSSFLPTTDEHTPRAITNRAPHTHTRARTRPVSVPARVCSPSPPGRP
jgi:hypothetical protein